MEMALYFLFLSHCLDIREESQHKCLMTLISEGETHLRGKTAMVKELKRYERSVDWVGGMRGRLCGARM